MILIKRRKPTSTSTALALSSSSTTSSSTSSSLSSSSSSPLSLSSSTSSLATPDGSLLLRSVSKKRKSGLSRNVTIQGINVDKGDKNDVKLKLGNQKLKDNDNNKKRRLLVDDKEEEEVGGESNEKHLNQNDIEEVDGEDSKVRDSLLNYHSSSSSSTTPTSPSLSCVIYLGHIPYGFFETEMRSFFSQFGDVLRLKLFRNKLSGSSKHFAFIEFAHHSVAQVVSNAMHRYMMHGRTLICHQVVKNNHELDEIFKGSEKPFRRIPYQKLSKEKQNKIRTVKEKEKRIKNLNKKDQLKYQQLKELGLEWAMGKRQNKTIIKEKNIGDSQKIKTN